MRPLFLLGCIPLRFFLVYLARVLPADNLKLFSLPLFLMAFGFLYLYFTNGRLQAPEAGGVTWWAPLRLVHGLLYLAAAVYAYQASPVAWVPLLVDVCMGLVVYLIHNSQALR